jgi:hypothetical protein
MARKSKSTFYRAKESFVTMLDGAPQQVSAGDLATADSAIVKGREALFEEVDESQFVRFGSSGVEQATAAPGEERIQLEPEPDEEAQSIEDFDSLTIAELKDVARSRGVTPGTLNKQGLIDAIKLHGQ